MNSEPIIPRYLEIANSIRSDIERETFSQGDLLPTEEELEKIYNVSRTTIRNAIGGLENEGLVYRKQGKGTIVLGIKPAQKLNYISSLTETFLQKGIHVQSINVTVERFESPKGVMTAFDLAEPQDVFLVRRTRVINNKPIAFVENYLISRLIPDFKKNSNKLIHTGLYRLLEDTYGITLKTATENISVYMSGPMESIILQIPERTPLFHSVRITYLEDGTPFEHVTSFIRCDFYKYNVFLKGRPYRNKKSSTM